VAENPEMEISPFEANHWWQKHRPAGILLNRLMLLFIFVPIALVVKKYYLLSFIVFAFMIPYGFFLRRLAVRAVRNHLAANPGEIEVFEQRGIIS
jgi:hypothetical protein